MHEVCFVLIWFWNAVLSFWLAFESWMNNSSATANILVKRIAFVYSAVCLQIHFNRMPLKRKLTWSHITMSISNSWPWYIYALCAMKDSAEGVEIFPNYSSLIDSLVLLWAERHLHTSLKVGATKTDNKRDMIYLLGLRITFLCKDVENLIILGTSKTVSLIFCFILQMNKHL